MRTLNLAILLVGATLAMNGCGSENTLTRDEANQVFDETKAALSRTINHAILLRNNRALELNFEFSLPCPDHGGIYAEASTEVNLFGESELYLYGALETCSEDGSNYIDGYVEIDTSLIAMPPNTSLRGDVEGRISYEGEVEGECDLDLTVEVGPLLHFDAHGMLCGFEF